jgi:DNA-binding response OmpR family regulator
MNRDETSFVASLCLIFKLTRTEGKMLAWLLAHDYSTREELRAAASHDGQTIAASSTSVLLNTLRGKLKAHNVLVTTVNGLGYGIDAKSRSKIRKEVAKYDGVSARPRNSEPGLKAAAPPD